MSNKESNEKLIECTAYFSKYKCYDKVLKAIYKKWKKYGRAAGMIKIEHPSKEEKRILEGFFAREFSDDMIRFPVREFESALRQTKFRGLSLEEVLDAYFQKELVTNKEEKRLEEEKRKCFFQNLLDELVCTYGLSSSSVKWFHKLINEKKYGYRIILTEYEKNFEKAYMYAKNVCQAVEILDKEKEIRLAVLAARVTKNPHEFDKNTVSGKLLIQALSCIKGGIICKTAEEVLMLYYMVGIRPDDISSFTTVYGIHFYTDEGEHPAYKGFIQRGESYVVTLSNLGKIKRVSTKRKQVFVVENQMVFSHLCEELQGQEIALVCTSGQVKTASWMLVDMLFEAGCSLFYSGDFDPEGLEIAEKILMRNEKYAKPWHMRREDYELAMSGEDISEVRLHKLDKITLPCLMEISDMIRTTKKAGYQERLLDKMLDDMRGEGSL